MLLIYLPVKRWRKITDFKVEGSLDEILERMADQFTVTEKKQINKPGADVFYHTLKEKVAPHRLSDGDKHHKGQHMIDTLKEVQHDNGAYEIGFTKAGKKAYIFRFLNDGWWTRNQYNAGRHSEPYSHVAGEHMWEDTTAETGNTIKDAEAKGLTEVMDKRASAK